ncbi:ferredoxin [Amycolatopsis orientalis]|uniref:ferredoxin n=1 Tax=Amycolatopsis orientalis TaxID=31958 RepID=UPI0003A7E114|nr:ferredoxin [Amycolatopsis orientalis]
MKAFLDSTKCSGYGACAEACPSVFEVDEFGFGAVIGDGTVPAGDEDQARAAVAACPEAAIRVED